MKRRQTQSTDGPGQDSFLDIVANIVGILIILVMVVGVRAKDAFIAAPKQAVEETPAVEGPQAGSVRHSDKTEASLDLTEAERTAQIEKSEVEDLAKRAKTTREQLQARFVERGKLQNLAAIVEHKIQEAKAKLDGQQQQDFELRRELQASHAELEDLVARRVAVENDVAPPQVLKHLPTPMAKTVFGEEAHFQLQGGRLAYVPMNEFVKQFREEAKLKTYKLEDAPSITEVMGPRDGFQFKYTLIKTARAIELDHFVLLPVTNELGEPLDAALTQGSAFRQQLRRLDPNRTTITVWTYPDSFAEFRRLKEILYNSGYLTAGRPMPEGQPIGGSPNGLRSASQ